MPDRPPNRTVSRRSVLSAVAAGSALGALSPAVAGSGRPGHRATSSPVVTRQGEGRFEYVVKFLCGFSEGEAVVPGQYRTAINVHNPNEEDVRVEWKVAVAGTDEPGPVTDFERFPLEPDAAVEVDCPRVAERVDAGQRFFKGFVVLRCDLELDVVAVYTAADEDQLVSALDVQDVEPRDREEGVDDGEDDGDDDDGGEMLPDLIPEFVDCRHEFIVRVVNRGSGPAGPSTTLMDFGDYGAPTAETPALEPDDSAVHAFVPDTGCYDPDCDFTLTVDAEDAVAEADEDNNVVEDVCIG